jgi:hypothetical protein
LTVWTGEAVLATGATLLVADLTDVDALSVGTAGLTIGSAGLALAGMADFATDAALIFRLLRRFEALAELLGTAAVLALLLAGLFLFLLLGLGGGNAQQPAEGSQRSAKQGAARIGQGAHERIELAAIHRADSWHEYA